MYAGKPRLLRKEFLDDGIERFVYWFDGQDVQVDLSASGSVVDVVPWEYRIVPDIIDLAVEEHQKLS